MGSDTVCARAPGKIILSGEHAVVYGRPALVTAVNRTISVTVTPAEQPRIRIAFGRSESFYERPLSEVSAFTTQIRARLREFDIGSRPIQSVVEDPRDLLLFNACDAEPNRGMDVALTSDIPIGSGMGSSAAAAAAILSATHAFSGNPLDRKRVEEKTQFSERLQHGTPSGVDAAACVGGGTLLFQRGQSAPKTISASTPNIRLVFTGKPESTTGECLTFIRKTVGDGPVWNDFARCTQHLLNALETKNHNAWLDGIRENHRLLCSIGVVPDIIQEQVRRIEQAGGAAKIAGAGTVSGDQAGILTVYAEDAMGGVFEQTPGPTFDVKGGVGGVELL